MSRRGSGRKAMRQEGNWACEQSVVVVVVVVVACVGVVT